MAMAAIWALVFQMPNLSLESQKLFEALPDSLYFFSINK
jgi:hypothetical protein